MDKELEQWIGTLVIHPSVLPGLVARIEEIKNIGFSEAEGHVDVATVSANDGRTYQVVLRDCYTYHTKDGKLPPRQ